MPKRPNAQMPTSWYAHMPKFMWANGHFSIVLDSSTNYLYPNAQTPNAHKLEIFIILIWKKKIEIFAPIFWQNFRQGTKKKPKKNRTIFVWAENSVNAKMTHTKIGLFFARLKLQYLCGQMGILALF